MVVPAPVALPPPAVAEQVFGDGLALAEHYAELLATDGVARGVIGPREGAVVWERHLLNSAVVAELIPPGASVLDAGSGAGLPGIPLAVARPDLRVTLLEPQLRRVRFLDDVVAALQLQSRVRVLRGRAEDALTEPRADVVTARALAPLPRLLDLLAPLRSGAARILALRGSGAAQELADADRQLRRHRLSGRIVQCGAGLVLTPTTVVELSAQWSGTVTGTPGSGA
jgi:16S rRNA (guanine527-N7)-methyltransferase